MIRFGGTLGFESRWDANSHDAGIELPINDQGVRGTYCRRKVRGDGRPEGA